MSTHAAVRHSGEVAIVDISGPVTLGEGCGLVRSTIKNLVSTGHKNILVNLQNVGYIDSAGLGELVGSYATISNLGGQIKLLNVAGRVNDLLQVTKLYTVFVTFSDESEAVRSFATAASA
jgi:anti-sigma B factor antagonist